MIQGKGNGRNKVPVEVFALYIQRVEHGVLAEIALNH
jgi:hypothetical protein